MELIISKNWRKLSKPRKLRGAMTTGGRWTNEAYCTTLRDALQTCYRKQVRGIEGSDAEKIREQMKVFEDEIRTAWSRFDEVDLR